MKTRTRRAWKTVLFILATIVFIYAVIAIAPRGITIRPIML